MNKKTKYKLKIILVVSYMVFIYVFSEYNFSVEEISEKIDVPVFSILPFLHVCEFGLLSLLLMITFYDKINIGILLSVSLLYGVFDEIHQYFIPYRVFDYKDILCNGAGSILGTIGFFVLMLIYNYFFVFPKMRWGNKLN